MKRIITAGLAAISGLMLATVSMAHHADADLMVGQLVHGEIYELTLVPNGADLLAVSEAMEGVDVVPDGSVAAVVLSFQQTSITEPMSARASLSVSKVDDAMRLWRSRVANSITVQPYLLI